MHLDLTTHHIATHSFRKLLLSVVRKLGVNFAGKLAKNLRIASSLRMKALSIFSRHIAWMDGPSKVCALASPANLCEERGKHHSIHNMPKYWLSTVIHSYPLLLWMALSTAISRSAATRVTNFWSILMGWQQGWILIWVPAACLWLTTVAFTTLRASKSSVLLSKIITLSSVFYWRLLQRNQTDLSTTVFTWLQPNRGMLFFRQSLHSPQWAYFSWSGREQRSSRFISISVSSFGHGHGRGFKGVVSSLRIFVNRCINVQ